MNTPSTVSFQSLSPLGISVALFLLYGLVYVLIGALAPVMQNTIIGRQATVSSVEKDNALLGGSTPDLLQAIPALAKLRTMLLTMIGGLLVTAGILVLAVAWFGLRQGQGWALGALALAGVAVFPFWWLVFKPFGEAGIRVGLDWPPFTPHHPSAGLLHGRAVGRWVRVLVPTVLLGPALVLGWIGLR